VSVAEPGGQRDRSATAEAASLLGRRLDGLLSLIGRMPGWGWALAAVIALVWTFPMQLHERKVFGVVLDDRLTVWLANLVTIALMIVLSAASLFALRSLVHYMEEDRWPKRAVGIEMEEMVLVQGQLERGADHLSKAADEARRVEGTLEAARDAIVFLNAELERVRGERADGQDERKKAEGQ
jgi:hypothetical protein